MFTINLSHTHGSKDICVADKSQVLELIRQALETFPTDGKIEIVLSGFYPEVSLNTLPENRVLLAPAKRHAYNLGNQPHTDPYEETLLSLVGVTQ